jgi:quinol monooxygenase YgiN
MIVITGQLRTDPATHPAFYARLKALCAPSRAEDGCLFYHVAMEDEADCVILLVEGWRDQAALDAHLALPAITEFMADFAGKVSMNVQMHEVSQSRNMALP